MMKLKQYAVWQEEQFDEKGEQVDGGYWSLYDSIADAIGTEGDGAEVYVLRAQFSGRYKLTTKTQRMRLRKKRKAA